MIQIILTTYMLQPLQVILLLVVSALFISVLIANRVILRRMRRHAKQKEFTTQMIRKALKNSKNNVLLWNIQEKYTTQLYGDMLSKSTITDEEGAFEMRVPMRLPETYQGKDAGPRFYNIVVSAIVTDQAFETHEARPSPQRQGNCTQCQRGRENTK